MTSTLRYLLIVAVGIAQTVNGQCPSSASVSTDHVNYASWRTRGYCSSTFYTQAQKQATCGFACGLCTGSSPPVTATCSGPDTSTFCAKWLARGFCRNTFYTAAQRLSFCCATCLPIINSMAATTTVAAASTTPTTTTTVNTQCANITTAARQTPVPNAATPAVTIEGSGPGAINALNGITVRESCSLILLDAKAAKIGDTVTSANQGQLTTTQQAAASATCTCPA